jgi:addiction module HigA family antidote
MAMHNPPHPGEFITDAYLEPNGLSGRELAATLGVSASTLNRILTGSSAVSPEWRCAFRRRWAALPRVGLPCSPTMTCGGRGNA